MSAATYALFGICCYVVCVVVAWAVRRLLPPFPDDDWFPHPWMEQ